MSEWIKFSERRPDSFPCICTIRRRDGSLGSAIFEAPTRRLLGSRWIAWIAFQWQDAPPAQPRALFVGPLPEKHQNFQQVAAHFDRMPPLTYEQKLEQFRGNREQLARMKAESQPVRTFPQEVKDRMFRENWDRPDPSTYEQSRVSIEDMKRLFPH